jgi:hypothetical protein
MPYNQFTNARVIGSDLRRRPTVQRLIVWICERVSRDDDKTIGAALGPNWKLVSVEDYPIYRHWNWQDMDLLRRYEFERIAPEPVPMPAALAKPKPAGGPTSSPTVAPW